MPATSKVDAFVGTERFSVIRRLGEGGAGIVYEAYDNAHGGRVALKRLRRLGADALLRFKNEFRSLQDLQHPNLVTLGELFEENGSWFFTMEFVEGVDFLKHVRAPDFRADDIATDAEQTIPEITAHEPDQATVQVRALDESEAVKQITASSITPFDERKLRGALIQLVRGLVTLHAAGKVHRDVKPSNVLVTTTGSAGRVVLLDFGLVLDTALALEEAESHAVVGTTHYMAPEQAAGLLVDPRADCYGVGVVLYRALTSRFPFEAMSERMLAEKRARPPSPRELTLSVPPDLDQLCVALLEPNPERRITSQEILRRLGAIDEREDPSFRISPPPPAATHFVGREVELALLREAFDQSLAGGCVAVVVSGDSGVGKSTVVRRFGELVTEECGALVLSGRCYEHESLPYKGVDGVVDALSRWLARLPKAECRELLPPRAALLPQVFPVLRRVEALADTAFDDEPLDPRELRGQLFAALRELLVRVASRSPLVLIIDDLQWSDGDSLVLLRELLRPPDAPALLLLGTLRTNVDGELISGATPTGGARAVDVAAFLPGEVRRLSLERLSLRAARELAELLLVRSPRRQSADLAEAIAREASGHPLFIDELVRHTILENRASPGRVRLEDALRARIERLDPTSRRVVELVCVAGSPIRQRVASDAARLGLALFARSVRSLSIANLVRTSGRGREGHVEPYHDRVRAAVIALLGQEEKRAWHQRIALAMELDDEADADALYAHWRAAGEPHKATRYARVAAEKAASALAFDRAAGLYRMMLRLGLEQTSAEEARGLRAKLGDALAYAGRGAEAAEAYLAAIPAAPADVVLDLQRRAAEQLLISGNFDEGLGTLKTVLGSMGMEVPGTRESALASLLLRRAQLRLRGLDHKERTETDIPTEDLRRLDMLGSISAAMGMVDTLRGADFQTRHLLLALKLGEPNRMARALALEASFSAADGSKSSARTAKIVDLARVAADRAGTPLAHAWSLAGRGMAAFLEGRWAEAHTVFEQSARIFRGRCVGPAIVWTLDSTNFYQLASLNHLGELREVARRLPHLIEEAAQRGDRYALTHLRTGVLTMGWLARGDPEGARREARDAIRSWSQEGTHLPHFLDTLAQSQIDLYEGRRREAFTRAHSAWAPLKGAMLLRVQFIRIRMLELRARTALALARIAPSEEALELRKESERSAREIEREGAAWGTALAIMLRAGIASQRGDAARAFDLFNRAEREFLALRMALHAAVAAWRAGELASDASGGERIATARAWLEAQAIVQCELMVEVLAPR